MPLIPSRIQKKDERSPNSGKPTHTLYLGDCLDVIRNLGKCVRIDAVVSDPPWGVSADTDFTRFSGGLSDSRNFHRCGQLHGGIIGDDKPFDPSPWLTYPKCALWGGNNFSQRLPQGNWLVWVKKADTNLGAFLSDAELCWMKGAVVSTGNGWGVYVKRHIWNGFVRESERGKTLHPSQKPVEVMKWTMERLHLKVGDTVLDPYTGSGATGLAALSLGINFIGIEIDETYFNIAKERIESLVGDGESLNIAPPLPIIRLPKPMKRR